MITRNISYNVLLYHDRSSFENLFIILDTFCNELKIIYTLMLRVSTS